MLPAVFQVYFYRREPDKALAYLYGIPRDWFVGGDGPGPIGFFVGQAQELAGRKDIARIEWEQALKLTEKKLADQPSSRKLISLRSRLLAFLGRFDEAEKSLQLGGEAGGYTDWYGLYMLRLREGRLDEAMDLYENKVGGLGIAAASLRLDPRLDPLRNNARFKALLAQAEVDPKRMPDPTPVPETRAATGAKPN
jgi:tetratricopeptide (TPR) repeat protein